MQESMFEDTKVQEIAMINSFEVNADYGRYFEDEVYEAPEDNGFIDIFHTDVSSGFQAFTDEEIAHTLKMKCKSIGTESEAYSVVSF